MRPLMRGKSRRSTHHRSGFTSMGRAVKRGFANRGWGRNRHPMHGAFKRRADAKAHALVDANGLPILLKITPGQADDGRSAADMFDSLTAGDVLLADRAYDSDALRAEMAGRGVWANVRAM